ncbi:nucleotidyltransferase domain-containing protein [Georgenia sp. H159]|uniref:nucleotidyltransferase domain-containing protein n=1 Tax=Georgenia sp. H159 TaxID=3076115 RepID=UPI002D79FFAC|nr:amino acid transporter [Georgenia sp. H159]
MSASEVHAVLDALAEVGAQVWVGGGWGVDALVGRQTRPHRDLDLAIESTAEQAALRALARLGYAVQTDWRPVRVEVAAPGDRWVDLHPVVFDEAGNGVQAGLDGGVFTYPAACFVTGTIAGREVGCLSVQQQLRFHSGYQPRAVDLADLALLRRMQR